MRVDAINNAYLQKVKTNKTQTNFKGFFGGTPSLTERFSYGMQALDDNSVLVVTSNPEASDVLLAMNADKIDTPIMKKYVLKVAKGDLQERDELDSDFAIFKKGEKYYALGLGKSLFSHMTVKKRKRPI